MILFLNLIGLTLQEVPNFLKMRFPSKTEVFACITVCVAFGCELVQPPTCDPPSVSKPRE